MSEAILARIGQAYLSLKQAESDYYVAKGACEAADRKRREARDLIAELSFGPIPGPLMLSQDVG